MADFVFLHPNWQMGGVERTNIQWAKALLLDGHRITFVTTQGIPRPADLPPPVVWIEAGNSAFRLFCVALSRIIKPSQVTILCQAYLAPKFLLARAWSNARSGTFWLAERNSRRQYQHGGLRGRIYGILVPLCARFFDKVIVNSHEMLEEGGHGDTRKVAVVVNPRFDDVEFLKAQPPREFAPRRIVFFGRWAAQKDPAFIQRFAEIAKSAGYEFEAHCGRSELAFQRPFVDNAFDYMLSNDIAILFCSTFEGYPNVLVEARATGLPVLFANCPTGSREIMADYRNGIEFSKQDEGSILRALSKLEQSYTVHPDVPFALRHTIGNSAIRRIGAAVDLHGTET